MFEVTTSPRTNCIIPPAGAILGVCAALLWTASGFIQFAYPEEKDKASVWFLALA